MLAEKMGAVEMRLKQTATGSEQRDHSAGEQHGRPATNLRAFSWNENDLAGWQKVSASARCRGGSADRR